MIVPEQVDPSSIELDFSNVSAQSQHFLSQRDMKIKSNLNAKNLYIGETSPITINLTKK